MADNKNRPGLFGLGKRNTAAQEPSPKESSRPYFVPWYDFSFEPDGVYVRFYYSTAIGSSLKSDLVRYDISRRGIEEAETSELHMQMLSGEMRCRIAPTQAEKPYDAGVYVSTTRDEMTASMQLLPPSSTGRSLTPEEVLTAIREQFGITYGLDEVAVLKTVESGLLFEPVVIAHGKPAVAGTDAKLRYYFKTFLIENSNRAELPPYNENEFFSIIHTGDMLVEKLPHNDGVAGITVRGMSLPAVEGRDCRLPEGSGVTVSPDGKYLYAAMDGRPYLKGNRIVMSDVFTVEGNVDLSVGDIDFDGDVLIGGNIQSGMIVRATGNIEIAGSVEAAAIDAGRNLVLYQGIQGADTGALRAGGDIFARYIIRASVEADGNLYGDYIVSSQISVMGTVRMMGSHAKIFGGMLRASSRVWVSAIGAVSGERTVIEIGSSPKLRKMLVELEEKRAQTKAQLEKIDNLVRVPVPRTETPERLEMRKKLIISRDMLVINIDEITRDIENLKGEIKKRSDGKLHVRGEVAADVKVSIDGIAMVTRTRAFSVTYKCRDGMIVASSYEGDIEES